MSLDYWKQQNDKPLNEDLLWSRPENRANAGSLLIVGGHKHDVFAPLKAYELAMKAGIGKATVATSNKVPAPVQASPDVVLLESSPSGGISLSAFNQLQAMASDTQVVIWPGSLGRDSETTQLLEKVLEDVDTPMVLSGDALDAVLKLSLLGARNETYLIITMAQLRTLQTTLKGKQAVVSGMQLTNLVEVLSEITLAHNFGLITLHENQLISAIAGEVVSTKVEVPKDKEEVRWRSSLAAAAAVLLAQFPSNPADSLASAAWMQKDEIYG